MEILDCGYFWNINPFLIRVFLLKLEILIDFLLND